MLKLNEIKPNGKRNYVMLCFFPASSLRSFFVGVFVVLIDMERKRENLCIYVFKCILLCFHKETSGQKTRIRQKDHLTLRKKERGKFFLFLFLLHKKGRISSFFLYYYPNHFKFLNTYGFCNSYFLNQFISVGLTSISI